MQPFNTNGNIKKKDYQVNYVATNKVTCLNTHTHTHTHTHTQTIVKVALARLGLCNLHKC